MRESNPGSWIVKCEHKPVCYDAQTFYLIFSKVLRPVFQLRKKGQKANLVNPIIHSFSFVTNIKEVETQKKSQNWLKKIFRHSKWVLKTPKALPVKKGENFGEKKEQQNDKQQQQQQQHQHKEKQLQQQGVGLVSLKRP